VKFGIYDFFVAYLLTYTTFLSYNSHINDFLVAYVV
jgi:hypothetical protein